MMVTIIVIALLFVGQVKSSLVAYATCMGVCFALLTACTGAGAGATVASGGVAAPAAIAICQAAALACYNACLPLLAVPTL